MANANDLFFLFITFSLILITHCGRENQGHSNSDYGKPCTYFGGTRVSSSQGNLINCSWYAHNACCKRTEVTSVFASMYPLYGASLECKNHINYLMCYFCSPQQYLWYNKKVHICAEYCESVYTHCQFAEYQGKTIGSRYRSGADFCEGQKFEVIGSNVQCFDFDPLVFGGSTAHWLSFILYMLPLSIAYYNFAHGS